MLEMSGAATRPVFVNEWFLNAVAPGAWAAVTVEQEGKTVGWLPYALGKRKGLTTCGSPALARVTPPVIATIGSKHETQLRHRLSIEGQLIGKLPPAQAYEFVLSGDMSGALAWQEQGYTTRLHHSFFICTQGAGDAEKNIWSGMRDKTRNLIRRAQDVTTVGPVEPDEFQSVYARDLEGRRPRFDLSVISRVAAAAIENDAGTVLGARDKDGHLHAATLFLRDASTTYSFMATRDRTSTILGANGLVYWTALLDAAKRKLTFDFDGITSPETQAFMQAFGGRVTNRIIVSKASMAFDAREWAITMKRRALGQPINRYI